MAGSSLFGRRIHIAGSVSPDLSVAPTLAVEQTRHFVQALVAELIQRGAVFVIPVDAEKLRPDDNLPICFDWLVWQTIHANLARRPFGAPHPLVIAVQHHKNEEQIPSQFADLWEELRTSDVVQIENVSHWNMNSKRMETQAQWGDVLLAVGGSEGVLFLANLYHDAGKPVIPLNAAIGPVDSGARRLFTFGLSRSQTQRLFQTTMPPAHTWINRINFTSRHTIDERVDILVNLLEALEWPKAFAVRLLNPDHPDYGDVQTFFETVVQPIVEDELGYKMVVIDGRQPYEHPRIDQEIFAKLHRSRVVLGDITGLRPNCFLEIGYALGRGLPTMLMVKKGSQHPFDLYTISALHWKTTGTIAERQSAFREHWAAIRNRPPLVPTEPLIP